MTHRLVCGLKVTENRSTGKPRYSVAQACSAGFPACGSWGLSSPQFQWPSRTLTILIEKKIRENHRSPLNCAGLDSLTGLTVLVITAIQMRPRTLALQLGTVVFRSVMRTSRQLSSVVEQRFCKPSVVGSNPTAGSIPKSLSTTATLIDDSTVHRFRCSVNI